MIDKAVNSQTGPKPPTPRWVKDMREDIAILADPAVTITGIHYGAMLVFASDDCPGGYITVHLCG